MNYYNYNKIKKAKFNSSDLTDLTGLLGTGAGMYLGGKITGNVWDFVHDKTNKIRGVPKEKQYTEKEINRKFLAQALGGIAGGFAGAGVGTAAPSFISKHPNFIRGLAMASALPLGLYGITRLIKHDVDRDNAKWDEKEYSTGKYNISSTAGRYDNYIAEAQDRVNRGVADPGEVQALIKNKEETLNNLRKLYGARRGEVVDAFTVNPGENALDRQKEEIAKAREKYERAVYPNYVGNNTSIPSIYRKRMFDTYGNDAFPSDVFTGWSDGSPNNWIYRHSFNDK